MVTSLIKSTIGWETANIQIKAETTITTNKLKAIKTKIFPKYMEKNDRTVKHCNFATTKTPSVQLTRKLQNFKPKAPRKIITNGLTGQVVW